MQEEYVNMIPGYTVHLDAPSRSVMKQNLRQQIHLQAATVAHLADMHPDRIYIACDLPSRNGRDPVRASSV